MRILKFDIYIGEKMVAGQSKNIVAIVEPKFYIPKGECDCDGTMLKKSNLVCFCSLYSLGTYFADLFDLIEDTVLIQATIYLNILSLHKTFKGKEIIDCIDRLDKAENLAKLRNFESIIKD